MNAKKISARHHIAFAQLSKLDLIGVVDVSAGTSGSKQATVEDVVLRGLGAVDGRLPLEKMPALLDAPIELGHAPINGVRQRGFIVISGTTINAGTVDVDVTWSGGAHTLIVDLQSGIAAPAIASAIVDAMLLVPEIVSRWNIAYGLTEGGFPSPGIYYSSVLCLDDDVLMLIQVDHQLTNVIGVNQTTSNVYDIGVAGTSGSLWQGCVVTDGEEKFAYTCVCSDPPTWSKWFLGNDPALTNERVPTEAGLKGKFSSRKTTFHTSDKVAGFNIQGGGAPIHWEMLTFMAAFAPKRNKLVVGSSAAIGGRYIAAGTFSIGDPISPALLDAYEVLVANGTITIGGVAHTPTGNMIYRVCTNATGPVWTTLVGS